MAFGNYNNNKNSAPTNTTYSPISFANPDSRVAQTRLFISYFNRVMRVSIAMRNNSTNADYATFDTDNQVSVYVSYMKAKQLAMMVRDMFDKPDRKNVCIELKNGLLIISRGAEFGSNNWCAAIQYASEDGHVNQIVYEFKDGTNMKAAYNYNPNGNTFENETKMFDRMELDTVIMCLEQYYLASSYAVAATVMEANMYKRDYSNRLLRAIADKVGANVNGGRNYASTTFLAGDGSSSNGGNHNDFANSMNPPVDYQTSTFDEIASGLLG